jgi:alcohol dehydrogenase
MTFDHLQRTRIVFGAEALERIGSLASEIGASRVLVVSDPGIVRAGHVARALTSLTAAGLQTEVFEGVKENPDTDVVTACANAARSFAADLLVGIGGGSSLDTAKGANFILTNGGEMRDYHGTGKATQPMLPFIAVPTTAGTGSECQSYALISDAVTHVKMACGDPKAAARIAILDPSLTCSQPVRVTAVTGIDAIAHALETAVTLHRNPLSLMYSREAFRLLAGAFRTVLQQPNDVDARGRMLLGAAFAGTAIENSMLGAAHASANPLTARFGVVHGQAVAVMLPSVIRLNLSNPSARADYELHARAAGLPGGDALPEAVLGWIADAGLAPNLQTLGVPRDSIPQLASDATAQWTGRFNPVPVTAPDFEALYHQAFA